MLQDPFKVRTSVKARFHSHFSDSKGSNSMKCMNQQAVQNISSCEFVLAKTLLMWLILLCWFFGIILLNDFWFSDSMYMSATRLYFCWIFLFFYCFLCVFSSRFCFTNLSFLLLLWFLFLFSMSQFSTLHHF